MKNEKNAYIKYKPTPKQLLFHESNADDCLYGGAKGGGKSAALTMDALKYALQNPGSDPHLFRETYDDLEANLIKEFKERTDKELYEFNESKHEARLKNGSVIKFRYVRNEEDASGYDGRSIPYVGVDELTKHDERTIQFLKSCNRTAKGFPVRFRATTNPGNKGHAWVKNRYIIPTNKGANTYTSAEDEVVQFIPSNVSDNPYIDKGYVKRLNNLPETKRKALRDGDWDIFEGQFFVMFGDHLKESPYIIPLHNMKDRLYAGLDYGYGVLGVSSFGMWYVDENNILHRLFTWYCEGKLPQEQALDLADYVESFRYTGGLPPVNVYCDTNMFANGTGVDASKAPIDYFKDAFYKTFGKSDIFVPANKQRANGWDVVADYFSVDVITKKPKMYYWDIYNKPFEMYIPQLIHDEKKPGDLEKCSIDHVADETRYLMLSIGKMYSPAALQAQIEKRQHSQSQLELLLNHQGGDYETGY